MNSQSLATSELIRAGYQVWTPISNKGFLIICKGADTTFLERCLVVKTCSDGSRQPIGRVSGSHLSHFADHLAFSDTDNKRCWLVPRADIAEFNTIRLGKRYEDYELNRKRSDFDAVKTVKDEQIKSDAQKLVKALKTVGESDVIL